MAQTGSKGLNDWDIALELLVSSKASLSTLAGALTETSNRQLRALLLNQLIFAAQDHFRLADFIASRQWYQPYALLQQQLFADVSLTKNSLSRP